MNFFKPIVFCVFGLSNNAAAIQSSVPLDTQTARNVEKMQKLAEKVKSLISRYSSV